MPSQSHQLDDVDLYYTDAYDIRILHNNHKKDGSGEKYLSNCDLVRENYVNKSNQSLCSCSNIVEPVVNISLVFFSFLRLWYFILKCLLFDLCVCVRCINLCILLRGIYTKYFSDFPQQQQQEKLENFHRFFNLTNIY